MQMRNWRSEHTEKPPKKGAGSSTKSQAQLLKIQLRPNLLHLLVIVPRCLVIVPHLLATVSNSSTRTRSRGGLFRPRAHKSTSRKALPSPGLEFNRNFPVGSQKTPNCLLAQSSPVPESHRGIPALRCACPRLRRVRPTGRACGTLSCPERVGHGHTCTPISAAWSHTWSPWPPPRAPPPREGGDSTRAIVRVTGDLGVFVPRATSGRCCARARRKPPACSRHSWVSCVPGGRCPPPWEEILNKSLT